MTIMDLGNQACHVLSSTEQTLVVVEELGGRTKTRRMNDDVNMSITSKISDWSSSFTVDWQNSTRYSLIRVTGQTRSDSLEI